MPYFLLILLSFASLYAQNPQVLDDGSQVRSTMSSTGSSSAGMPEVTDPEILKKFQNLDQEMGKAEIADAPKEERTLGGFALQMFFSLLVVVGLIWLCVWGLKKMQKSRFNLHGIDPGLQIVEQMYLGAQQRVVVVRIHERVFALGVTPQNIQLLSDLSQDEAYQGNEATAKEFGKSVDYFLRHFKKGSTISDLEQGGKL